MFSQPQAAAGYWQEKAGCLQRFNQLVGQQSRLLREILRSRPITRFTGFVRLAHEALDLLDQVALRSAELFSRRLLEIFLGRGDVVFCFALKRCLIAGRNLR